MSANPESSADRPFSASDPGSENPFGQENPFEQAESSGVESAPSSGGQLSMAWDVARLWIKDNQRPAMLGAFAAGVFVGAYLRD